MVDDADVFARIHALVEEEHELNDSVAYGDQHARRQQIEEQLDQCWDLLRQRQARRDAGQRPDQAQVRPKQQVEEYLQ